MNARPTPATTSLLYDAVALGMWAYVRVAFRVETLALERIRLEPGVILAATHRSDSDVPVLCATLYKALHAWQRRELRPAFAVRPDLFIPGFFAGYPRGVPASLRHLLFGVSIGRVLNARLACFPIRSANRMRLVELLRAQPSVPLSVLADAAAQLEARARSCGLPVPQTGQAALRGVYADLLWQRVVSREETAALDGLGAVWARRTSEAADDVRQLVDVLRGGGMLFLFPEGRPSPDGAVGPLMPGVRLLTRRGGGCMQPLALAYDPLTRGRPLVLVTAGDPLEPPIRDVERQLLRAFRKTLALTAGELAAAELLARGRIPTADECRELAHAERARGRLVEPALLDDQLAAARTAEAAAAASTAPRHVLERLARTHASVQSDE